MNAYLTYGIIAVVLFVLELVYFRIADKFNIIDKPNERSSHSSIVLRGGGIIFLIGVLVWALVDLSGGFGVGQAVYPWFLLAVLLAAGISFVDDVRSLPDSVRLVVQFVAMGLLILQLAVSLGFIFICPLLATSCGLPLVAWHWIYLAVAFVLLVVAYVLFKKKYYHLHEEYLASLKK